MNLRLLNSSLMVLALSLPHTYAGAQQGAPLALGAGAQLVKGE